MAYVAVFVLVSFVILIHELGHFIAARLSRIPIERFSLGFGPKLWALTTKRTEYRISAFPFGGYVLPRIANEDDYFRISPLRRIIFALGGPMANFIMAVICLSILNTATNGFSFRGTFIAPFVQVVRISWSFICFLPSLFSQPGQLSGIVGVVAVGGQFVAGGLTKILQFAIMININLALLNLLPLPPLDGGKIFFCILERIHHSLIRLRVPVTITGWVLLFALLSYVTVLDVCKYILGTAA